MTSFIERFVEYCDGAPTPRQFAKWGAISLVSGAIERRVWAFTRNTQLIPNMFILLVAPPGVGKSRIISEIHDFWTYCKLNVCPSSVTGPAILDVMADRPRMGTFKDYWTKKEEMIMAHALQVASPEFGVMLTKNDLPFMNTINELYDCRPIFEKRLRSMDKTMTLENPYINLIAGTQPKYLGEILPDTAYEMGFTSRSIMVYSSECPNVPLFGEERKKEAERGKLKAELKEISQLCGLIDWEIEAQIAIQEWIDKGMQPVPQHAKLKSYSARRDLYVLKLCMIRAASNKRCKVFKKDFDWALGTLLEAEIDMGSIFHNMHMGADSQVIEDTLEFIESVAGKNAQGVIALNRVVEFLAQRTSASNVQTIINLIVSSGKVTEALGAHNLKYLKLMKHKEE